MSKKTTKPAKKEEMPLEEKETPVEEPSTSELPEEWKVYHDDLFSDQAHSKIVDATKSRDILSLKAVISEHYYGDKSASDVHIKGVLAGNFDAACLFQLLNLSDSVTSQNLNIEQVQEQLKKEKCYRHLRIYFSIKYGDIDALTRELDDLETQIETFKMWPANFGFYSERYEMNLKYFNAEEDKRALLQIEYDSLMAHIEKLPDQVYDDFGKHVMKLVDQCKANEDQKNEGEDYEAMKQLIEGQFGVTEEPEQEEQSNTTTQQGAAKPGHTHPSTTTTTTTNKQTTKPPASNSLTATNKSNATTNGAPANTQPAATTTKQGQPATSTTTKAGQNPAVASQSELPEEPSEEAAMKAEAKEKERQQARAELNKKQAALESNKRKLAAELQEAVITLQMLRVKQELQDAVVDVHKSEALTTPDSVLNKAVRKNLQFAIRECEVFVYDAKYAILAAKALRKEQQPKEEMDKSSFWQKSYSNKGSEGARNRSPSPYRDAYFITNKHGKIEKKPKETWTDRGKWSTDDRQTFDFYKKLLTSSCKDLSGYIRVLTDAVDELYTHLAEGIKTLDKMKKTRVARRKLQMDRNTMSELRRLSNPPRVVHGIVQAMLLLLGEDELTTMDWDVCKILLSPTGSATHLGFNRRIALFKASDVNGEIAKRVQDIMDGIDFDAALRTSPAAAACYVWTMGVLDETVKVEQAANIHRQQEIFNYRSPYEGSMTSRRRAPSPNKRGNQTQRETYVDIYTKSKKEQKQQQY